MLTSWVVVGPFRKRSRKEMRRRWFWGGRNLERPRGSGASSFGPLWNRHFATRGLEDRSRAIFPPGIRRRGFSWICLTHSRFQGRKPRFRAAGLSAPPSCSPIRTRKCRRRRRRRQPPHRGRWPPPGSRPEVAWHRRLQHVLARLRNSCPLRGPNKYKTQNQQNNTATKN